MKSCSALHGLPKAVVDEQLTSIMQNNAINPVVDWLSTLKRKQSNNPINDLVDTLPLGNKKWVKIVFYRWFIQCVAAADHAKQSENKEALPKYESVLTFFGGQGLQKTAFIRALLPHSTKPYLKDGILLDLSKTDSKTEALSAWITELGELDSTFKKSDISALKAFLSRREDEIRRPYAKAASISPRQTSFFGSVNEERFLRDSTGNRRYLPITVHDELKIPDSFNCTEFWAFVWQEYINGAQWWLTKDEEQLQVSALKLHEDNSFEEMLLDEFLFDEDSRIQLLTGNDILDILKVNRSRSNSTSLGNSLKKLDINKNTSREYQMPPTRPFRNRIN